MKMEFIRYRSTRFPQGHYNEGLLLPPGVYYAVPGGKVATQEECMRWAKEHNVQLTLRIPEYYAS
jgi:hypothetical protein